MKLHTETGENCVTKAEDAVAAALGACDAWRTLCRPYGALMPAGAAEALERVAIDTHGVPLKNGEIPLEQIEAQGVLATVYAQPENPYAVDFSQPGLMRGQTVVEVQIESYHPRREVADGVNLRRRVKNLVPDILDETASALRATKGDRWMQAAELAELAALRFEEHERAIVGTRTLSVLLFTIGPGEAGSGGD